MISFCNKPKIIAEKIRELKISTVGRTQLDLEEELRHLCPRPFYLIHMCFSIAICIGGSGSGTSNISQPDRH